MTALVRLGWGLLFAVLWGARAHAQDPVQGPAQPCVEELRTLQAQQQRFRAEVLEGNTSAAIALAAQRNLAQPAGYEFENHSACQKWTFELANAQRASCSIARAREQLKSIKTEQALVMERVRVALERLTHTASIPFTCKDKKKLQLICQPASDTVPDAWCARSVENDDTLEFPRTAWCKLVDEHGEELGPVDEATELTCPEHVEEQRRSERRRLRAERRGTVAVAGTGIAVMAAIAVPVTFVPMGVASLLRRWGALGKDNVERLRHRSYRARARVLPLLGVTALSVSSLSSRFWWAGILAAGSGVSADVLLAQHWHHHDTTRRNIGIATAVIGGAAGLVLNLETMGWSDTGSRYAFLPTLRVGVAEAELGVAGRF